MDHGEAIIPNPWMMLPFGLLLAMIALGPLFFLHWWEKHYPKVAYVLGAITLGYYLFGLHAYHTVSHTAIEYVSFIALVGSLYVVSGGIHITVKGEATPFNNLVFLLVGAVLANILGTTGASMLMIRPWIRMNKYRITAHHIVFFIFIVLRLQSFQSPLLFLFRSIPVSVPFPFPFRTTPACTLLIGLATGSTTPACTGRLQRLPKRALSRFKKTSKIIFWLFLIMRMFRI